MLYVKAEGPSDTLALATQVRRAGKSGEIEPFCNTNGAQENPVRYPSLRDSLNEQDVVVVHDCDVPGQQGALFVTGSDGTKRAGWCPHFSQFTRRIRNAVLPFDIQPSDGKDLRDYFKSNSLDDFLTLVENTEPYVPDPADLNSIGAQPIEGDNDPYRLARVNLSRYDSHREGATLRFWRDEWFKWDGRCYVKIKKSELHAKVSRSVKDEFDRLSVEKQAQARDDIDPTALRVTRGLVTNVIDATAGLVVISDRTELMSWIDDDGKEKRNYIAMQNGILDLEAHLKDPKEPIRLIDHSPRWFSTVCLPYSFDPKANCPKFLAFLRKNLEGDLERIRLVQEWMGYTLLPTTDMQKFLANEGEGSNGKSVLTAVLTALVGKENCSHIALEMFADRFQKTETLGKLINFCADAGEIDKLAEGHLKSFTSGDAQYFDRKNIEGISAVPTARLVINFNNRPRFTDRSGGIWRRMILMPWNYQVKEAEKVRGMDKAAWWEGQPGELAGIFNFAVRGLYRLRQQGEFTRPRVCEDALMDYRRESNPAAEFLADMIEASEEHDDTISTQFLYLAYVAWARKRGVRALGESGFGKEVRRMFPEAEKDRIRYQGNRVYVYRKLLVGVQEIVDGFNKEDRMRTS